MFYDMAIDAGAATEDERWQMAAMLEEEYMFHIEQSWREEQEQIEYSLGNIIIHMLPGSVTQR